MSDIPKVAFVCPTCNARDVRDQGDEMPKGAPPEILFAWLRRSLERAVREEVREAALLDAPMLPLVKAPYDTTEERGLVAAALAGIQWAGVNRLRREHFFSRFFGYTWELCREMTAPGKKPDLPTIAARFESMRLGEKTQVWKALRDLDENPWIAIHCNDKSVQRVLDLAWQRELYYDSLHLSGLLADVSVTGGLNSQQQRTEVRAWLLDMLGKLEGGPNGDPVLNEIERVIAESHGDTTTPARKARAEKFARHRDIIYQAAAVVGWLKRDDTDEALVDARARIAKYIERLDQTREALYDIWQKLSGGGADT